MFPAGQAVPRRLRRTHHLNSHCITFNHVLKMMYEKLLQHCPLKCKNNFLSWDILQWAFQLVAPNLCQIKVFVWCVCYDFLLHVIMRWVHRVPRHSETSWQKAPGSGWFISLQLFMSVPECFPTQQLLRLTGESKVCCLWRLHNRPEQGVHETNYLWRIGSLSKQLRTLPNRADLLSTV